MKFKVGAKLFRAGKLPLVALVSPIVLGTKYCDFVASPCWVFLSTSQNQIVQSLVNSTGRIAPKGSSTSIVPLYIILPARS